MTTLLFQRRFVEPILAGTKRQTIRPRRKRPIRVGQQLSLRYWKDKPYRSRQVEFAKVECALTVLVRVIEDGIDLAMMGERTWQPMYEKWQPVRDVNHFARGDGFKSWAEMRELFQSRFGYGLPFEGVLYQWEEVNYGPN